MKAELLRITGNCQMTGCNVHRTDLNQKVLDKIQYHIIIIIIIIIIDIPRYDLKTYNRKPSQVLGSKSPAYY
jgi:hypothetical protein